MDTNKFQSALRDFVIACYQKEGEFNQVLHLNQTSQTTPVSFPDLVVFTRNIYINALDQSNEYITQRRTDDFIWMLLMKL